MTAVRKVKFESNGQTCERLIEHRQEDSPYSTLCGSEKSSCLFGFSLVTSQLDDRNIAPG
jgi:hypothetical protein